MSALEVIARARNSGIKISLAPEGALSVDGPFRKIAAIKGDIAKHRDEILTVLHAELDGEDAPAWAGFTHEIRGSDHTSELRAFENAERDRTPRAILSQKQIDALTARGWIAGQALDVCALCGHGTIWRDELGDGRHPWCLAE